MVFELNLATSDAFFERDSGIFLSSYRVNVTSCNRGREGGREGRKNALRRQVKNKTYLPPMGICNKVLGVDLYSGYNTNQHFQLFFITFSFWPLFKRTTQLKVFLKTTDK